MHRRAIVFATALVATSWTFSGCLSKASRQGLSPHGSGSVLTAVEGIDAVDRENAKTVYWLKCDGDVEVKHTKIIEKGGEEFLQFDGTRIKDGATCKMEVWNKDVAADPSYIWRAVKGDDVVPGLLYSTSTGEVRNRSLSLIIYKTYLKRDVPTFQVTMAVAFAGTDALQQDKMSATLFCGIGDDKKSYTSNAVVFGTEDRQADVILSDLPVSEIDGKSCGELHVVEGLADDQDSEKKTYAAILSDVLFAGDNKPEAGKDLRFPKAGEPAYELKIMTGGPVDLTIKPGECFRVEVGNSGCSDKRSFTLPFAKNYMVAYVKGLTEEGRGEPREYVVGIGDAGFSALAKREFHVDDINKALSSSDESVKKAFSFWKGGTKIIDDIKAGKLLTGAMVSGDAYANSRIDRASLAGIKFLHVDKLWVHGFHAVADINAEGPPMSWLAVVEAKKDTTTLTYAVGGIGHGFSSDEFPLPDDEAKMVSFAGLVADAGDASFDKWRVLQTRATLGDGCSVENWNDLVGEASHAAVASTDGLGLLAGCGSDPATLTGLDAASYDVTLKGYRLGWTVVSGN